MRNLIAAILAISVSCQVVATGLPEKVVLSPESANSLGFSMSFIEEVGEPKTWIVSLRFPVVVEGDLRAARVQTYLLNKTGQEVSSTSADYTVLTEEASLLFHYRPEVHDMAVVVQYLSSRDGHSRVVKAYTIGSVSEYLITSQGSEAPSARDAVTGAPA